MTNNDKLAEALRDCLAFLERDMPTASSGPERRKAREALAANEAQPVQDERAAFEAWLQKCHPGAVGAELIGKEENASDSYTYFGVNKQWRAWQARAALAATPAPAPEADAMHAFKNFHRNLCNRFGYFHDDENWERDLCSLEEHIAGYLKLVMAAATTPAEPADSDVELRSIGDALLAAHDHLEMHKLERSHCNSAAAIRDGLATYSAWKKRGDMTAEKLAVTPDQAAEALDSLDDFARMGVGVDARGPRKVLEQFIEQARAALAAHEAEAKPAEPVSDPCLVLWQAMNEAQKVGNRTDDKLIVEFLRRAGYVIAAAAAAPASCGHQWGEPLNRYGRDIVKCRRCCKVAFLEDTDLKKVDK